MSTLSFKDTVVQTGLYINGEWVRGRGEQLETVNPATEEVLGKVRCMDHRAGCSPGSDMSPQLASSSTQQRQRTLTWL